MFQLYLIQDMASNLTPEQQQRIEENRKLALQKRLAKLSANGQGKQSSTAVSFSAGSCQPSDTYIQSSATGSRPLLTFAQSSARSNQPSCMLVKPSSVSGNQLITSFVNRVPHSRVKVDSDISKENQKHDKSFLTKTEIKKEVNSLNITKNLSCETVSGQTTLISKDRFLVEIPYNQNAVEVFKTINGKRYG